uniref:Uncharacterized protein n=1 Tax=Lactuca sativa TaxID=4236 RepID=A0A9R1X1Y4_LACSA|nr:hypothetical protein LSAT_V11C700373820 [Lactuca sativa]
MDPPVSHQEFKSMMVDEEKPSGKEKGPILMYPRFLQMVFNEKYPQTERSSDTLHMKALAPSTFGHMKQSRKAVKVAYHDIEVSDDEENHEDQGNELSENEFENFIQKIILFLEEDIVVTPLSVIERERDTMVQSSSPTPE